MDEIWQSSIDGSVLLTGSPGIGKSWVIAEFLKVCQSHKRLTLPLLAQEYEVASLEELKAVTGLRQDLPDFLKSLGSNSVLIIDGLDALRSEKSQRPFRTLISTVASQVPDCSIVASIRTFDLEQSEELQELFFRAAAQPGKRSFRKIAIDPFTDSDLHQLAASIPALHALLRESRDDLTTLMRNAFNLGIVLRLLEEEGGADDVSASRSQIELLTKYWRRRIDIPVKGEVLKTVLHKACIEMIDARSLSVRFHSAFLPGTETAITELKSLEVLRESATGRLSFSHNIMFDYAVARLVLDELKIIDFLTINPANSIFFRPSVGYFLGFLWLYNRPFFWGILGKFFKSAELPARSKVLPCITIVELARTIEELQPLLDGTSPWEKDALRSMLISIQALDGMASKRRGLWLWFLHEVVLRFDLTTVNEIVSLLAAAASSATSTELLSVGKTARKLLEVMWSTAEALSEPNAVNLASLAAGRVLPVVLQLFATDSPHSSDLVRQVIARFGNPRSSSSEAYTLVRNLKVVIPANPALAADVYHCMFQHHETSDQITSLGGGPTLRMTSTRRQDFESARYGLSQAFPLFLDRAPVEAAQAAVRCVNAEIEGEPLAQPEGSEENPRFEMTCDGETYLYQSDFSEIWDHGDHLSIQLLDTAVRFAANATHSDEKDSVLANFVLGKIFSEARTAVIWKRVIDIASQLPGDLSDAVVPLLKSPAFLAAPEVTIAIGEFLKASYGRDLISSDTAREIEEAILRIPQADIVLRYEKPATIRDRLLNCIPTDKLQSKTARDLREKLRQQESESINKPYHRTSFKAVPFTEQDWLRNEGVDPGEPQNAAILETIKPLSAFESRFLNEVPPSAECTQLEPVFEKTRTLLSSPSIDTQIRERAEGIMCAAAKVILKNPDLGGTSSVIHTCREVVLQGSSHPSPIFDPEHHLPFTSPHWGAPSPRIEAAQGLAQYLWNYGLDEEVTTALKRLSRDKVPAVRYQVARSLLGLYKHNAKNEFWELIREMVAIETTEGVALALSDTLGRVASLESPRALELIVQILNSAEIRTERHELTRSLMQTITGLYVARDSPEAERELSRLLSDVPQHTDEIHDSIFVGSYYIRPNEEYSDEVRIRADRLYERVVNAAIRALHSLPVSASDSTERAEVAKQILQLIDEVIFRIYIALDVEPGLRNQENESLTDAQRSHLYFELKPILNLIATWEPAKDRYALLPRSAHHLMETLYRVLSYDPRDVIKFAMLVCKSAELFNYQFDQDAVSLAIRLVDRVLADYKDLMLDSAAADAVGQLLDIFVRAGWPQAVQTVIRLDRAVR